MVHIRRSRTWKTRNGALVTAETSMDYGGGDDEICELLTAFDKECRKLGWEGHVGGWWRYAIRDLVYWAIIHSRKIVR